MILGNIVPPVIFNSSLKDIIENLKVYKDGEWFSIKIIETDIFPYKTEAFSYTDDDLIKITIIKDYEKYFSRKRKNWTLFHEFCHICLGHVFLNLNLSSKQRWYLDKEANKLVREFLMPESLVKASIFKGEEVNPLKIKYFSSLFNISNEAAKNTLIEYGFLDKNEYRCLFFPEILECISLHDWKKCIKSKTPHKKCVKKASEKNFDYIFPIFYRYQ
ncbi:MAG TPA: ImmA/IrrE family metallo-endopeptidase [Thermoanaerobacterales bacterium]|nr:ImmA/IrrE family metallo-endopeptidase [Thermoanaerobacterales bacterium]